MANIYNDPQQPSAFGGMLMMGGFFAADMAYHKAVGLAPEQLAKLTLGKQRFFETYKAIGGKAAFGPQRTAARQLLTGNLRRYNTMSSWWGRPRARRRLAGRLSRTAWEGFLGGGEGKFFNFAGRMKGAGGALQGLGILKGKMPVLRALAAGPLSFLSSYMIWGSLIPAAVDLGLGIFNEAAAEGRRLRGGTPETVSKQYDMATRQQAFTMRQASMMAMHHSQLGVRAALGNEASFLH